MPNVTAICYFFSLLFYGMGYSKMLVLNTGHMNTYDYTIYVSLATVYFVLTIFLAVTGSLYLYVKNIKDQGTIEIDDIEFRLKAGRGSDDRRRASIPVVKAQLSQSEYGVDLEEVFLSSPYGGVD
ncbi:hypothetical protein [Desulfosporosinus sp. SB140]|uniref:hypothetical protein n=1 Tax=Desulfosporosinus paludis TaxID=3115649 RepID=UPI00389060A7